MFDLFALRDAGEKQKKNPDSDNPWDVPEDDDDDEGNSLVLLTRDRTDHPSNLLPNILRITHT